MADRRNRNDRVIRFRDGGRDLVIYRYGTGADDLPLFPGSRIEVAKNQFIAFVRDGELLDTWDAGEYLLGYEMFPALAEKGLIQFRPYRPVDAQLYFLNLNRISDLKWATRTPALKEQGGKMYQIRAYGKYAFKISDGIGFMLESFLRRGLQTTFDVLVYLPAVIAGAFAIVVEEMNVPVTGIINHYSALSDLVMMRANETTKKYGIEITGVLIEGASLPM